MMAQAQCRHCPAQAVFRFEPPAFELLGLQPLGRALAAVGWYVVAAWPVCGTCYQAKATPQAKANVMDLVYAGTRFAAYRQIEVHP